MPITVKQTGPTIESPSFRNQWLNFSLYFIQFKYLSKRDLARSKYCSFLLNLRERLRRNDNPLGGRARSNQFLVNGEYFKTDFITVNKEDMLQMIADYPQVKGYSYAPATLKGVYKSKDSYTNNNMQGSGAVKTFYRGLGNADCLQFLVRMNII
jgi:hypothetical protein